MHLHFNTAIDVVGVVPVVGTVVGVVEGYIYTALFYIRLVGAVHAARKASQRISIMQKKVGQLRDLQYDHKTHLDELVEERNNHVNNLNKKTDECSLISKKIKLLKKRIQESDSKTDSSISLRDLDSIFFNHHVKNLDPSLSTRDKDCFLKERFQLLGEAYLEKRPAGEQFETFLELFKQSQKELVQASDVYLPSIEILNHLIKESKSLIRDLHADINHEIELAEKANDRAAQINKSANDALDKAMRGFARATWIGGVIIAVRHFRAKKELKRSTLLNQN